MARKSTGRQFVALRRLLLVALLALAGAVGYLYWSAREERRPPTPPVAPEGAIPEGEITTLGEEFEFALSDAERESFRIRGERMRADRGGTVWLEGVELDISDEEGRPYRLSAENAVYHRGEREARLTGSVHLQGEEGLELATQGLELERRGRQLESLGPVVLGLGNGWRGSGRLLRAYLPDEDYLLAGNARLANRGRPGGPVVLTARRIRYDRQEAVIRAEGEARLVHGDDRIEAFRLTAFLSEDASRLLFARAVGEVSGTFARARGDGGPGAAAEEVGETASPIRWTARSASLLFDERGEPQRMKLDGGRGERVAIETRGEGGTSTRLTAGEMTSRFAADGSQALEAVGRPRLVERTGAPGSGSGDGPAEAGGDGGGGGEELRRMVGDAARADVAPDGTFGAVTFTGNALYRAPDLEVRGEQARFDPATGDAVFTGDPVIADGERGRLEAPRLELEEATGRVHASGGVRARLAAAESGALGGVVAPSAPSAGQAGEPIRVASLEAFFQEEPRGFLFRGAVRVVQGDSVLLAEELVGQEAQDRLEARGGVRTVWTGAIDGAGGEDGTAGNLEVTADHLEYRRAEDLVLYRGDVRMEQDRRILECRELDVELAPEEERDALPGRADNRGGDGDDGSVERMICRGDVELEDPVGGKRVRAARAVYRPALECVVFSGGEGEPAEAVDAQGGIVRAPRLAYDLATGRVSGSADAAAECDP